MKTVLVVDDNPLVREAICKTIHWDALGCALIGAFANGQEGCEFASLHHPDIIITDIKMPLMDGWAMLDALKAAYTGFCFIVITGFGEFEYAQRALRLGAIDILLKPIENKELIRIVQRAVRLLEGERGAEPAPEPHLTRREEIAYNGEALVPYDAAVRRAIEFIHENLGRKISMTELADYVGLSPAHLSRLIKKNTQKSFVDIANELRIEEAIHLLRKGKYKVYEVSNMVGIDNYAYFYQLFKKMTGRSPKDFM